MDAFLCQAHDPRTLHESAEHTKLVVFLVFISEIPYVENWKTLSQEDIAIGIYKSEKGPLIWGFQFWDSWSAHSG